MLEVFTESRFVAQTPEEDGGAVLVPDHASLYPVEGRFAEPRVVGEQREFRLPRDVHPIQLYRTVGFEIGLGNDVKAVFGAKLRKPGGVGIMAGADRVDVISFISRRSRRRLLPG